MELFVRSNWDLPRVDVPDWELVRQLVDLLRPYARGGEDADFWAISARDERGTYSDTEIGGLKVAMARRGEPPESIEVSVRGFEKDTGIWRQLEVMTQNARSSQATLTSGDEAIVAHCSERTAALMAQAAARRAERDTKPARADQSNEPASVAPSSTRLMGWRKWSRDPNPWALFIVSAVVAGFLLAIIFAALHYLH